jgi:hypothetical protein
MTLSDSPSDGVAVPPPGPPGDDASRDGLPPESVPNSRSLGGTEPPSSSLTPALRASWLLRVTAVAAGVGAALGVVVAPGLRGIAADRIVDPLNRLSWTVAYFMCGTLVTAIVLAATEISRNSRVHILIRATAIGAAGAVLAFSSPALFTRLPVVMSFVLVLAASVTSLACALAAVRARHTRAVAVVVGAFAVAALLRMTAWELAKFASDRYDQRLYLISRGVATAGIVVEGVGQMIAAAWLGTRSRFAGQTLSSLAVAAAFLVTWGAARGAAVVAPPWQSALHSALADAPGLPPPLGLHAFAIFLVVAAILLALVAAVQPRQVVAVVAALSLALMARGAFDVPLHALSATAGALWLVVAVTDDRAMWRSLIVERERRLAEERGSA